MRVIRLPKSVRCLFALLLLIIVVSNLSAQLRRFDKIPAEDGDVNLSVRQIIQDTQGFLWMATFSGLYRFEGDEFILQHRYWGNNQINSDVTALLQDDSNNIWIGTNGGLFKFNSETEAVTTFRYEENQPNSIGSDKIRSLAMDKNGRIWIGTYDKGLFLYDPDNDRFTPINFEKDTSKGPTYVKTIFADDDDRIWIGTLGDGLYRFSYKNSHPELVVNFRKEDENRILSDNFVYEIFKDLDGTLVVGTHNGLNVFNPTLNQFEDISSDTFLPGSITNYFRSVFRDKNGKLWIGTWGGLILCDSFGDIQSGKFQLVEHSRDFANSISHNQVMDVFQDRSGIIWLATENGLNRYDPYFNQFQPLFGEVINEISEQTATDFCSYKGGMLMLTLSDGVIEKKENQFKMFFQKALPEFRNQKFYSLCVDSENNVWGGSNKGLLVKFSANTQTVSSYKHSSANIPIYSIVELEKNILAIGTFGEGLKYFNIKTNHFQRDLGLSEPAEINKIHVDSKKRLWVATQLGIFKKEHRNESFEYFLPDNPDSILKPNIFIDIAESVNGDIYVGGRNGLYVYDESSTSFSEKRFETQTQLWVTNLQFDSKQNLWMNLNFNKVAKWDRRDGHFFTFNVNNGIRSSANNRRGFFIDTNDRLFISGFDQVFEFNVANPLQNSYSPTPVFTQLRINNTEIHPGLQLNDQQILDRNISFEKEITLNHLNKDFTISFGTASYLNSKENHFRYLLKGYDEDWHKGTENSASYTNLPSGQYTFEVFSANNDGVWSKEPARLNIRIMPAPWLSKMAFFVYSLLFIVFSYFVRRIILIRIKLRQELLIEKVKRDKEEKFNQERLRFYTNISHELRTPLTLIMGPTKDLLNNDKPNSESARLHQLILNNSQRLLSLVNQLLDFRKSLHQGMKLKVVKTNLLEVVESNIDAFAYMADEKHIQVEFKASERKLVGWYDLEKLDIILFNILSNAFKYTPDYGFVTLEVKTAEPNDELNIPHVEMSISNSGKGIPKSLQEKVFKRFYQVVDKSDDKQMNTGTGIGLALVKAIVELHHGRITLGSVPGKSTRFTIFLPIHMDNYSEEEIFDFTRDTNRRTKELIKSVGGQNEDSVFEKKETDVNKLLIVEDNHELRDYLVGFLSREYKVYAAPDGVEGLALCKTKNPDLVVSDVMMDNMDGLQFCEVIKSTPEISHIPVMLMTALATVENKLAGYKTGADDYITKPFEPELLKIRIRNILENRSKIRSQFRHDEKVTTRELTISRIDEEFLNKVIDLVDENLDNADFDIDSFSKHLGVSSSQLYRKIKGVTGVSPNEFLRGYRLRKAAKMIRETNLNISEIAYKVGFNDSRYFSRCFKKEFGVVPTKYAS